MTVSVTFGSEKGLNSVQYSSGVQQVKGAHDGALSHYKLLALVESVTAGLTLPQCIERPGVEGVFYSPHRLYHSGGVP